MTVDHVYYRLVFTLISPLSIGSGRSDNTDKDILLDKRGMPFIPASSLAGVMRHAYDDIDKQNLLFGKMNSEHASSHVIVHDALPTQKQPVVSERDSVALDSYKAVIVKKKFDCELVEPGAEFLGLLQIKKNAPEGVITELERLLEFYMANGICLGAKTRRGMGKARVRVYKKAFSFPDEVNAWLEFDPFQPMDKDGIIGGGYQALKASGSRQGALKAKYIRVRTRLSLRGGLSIRTYMTDVDDVDFSPMRYNPNDPKQAILPGTSWAGAFKAHMHMMLAAGLRPPGTEDNPASLDSIERDLFGYVNDQRGGQEQSPSRITFSETLFHGGYDLKLTRNAIDRFSGKTKDKALYSEKIYYGGTGELEIGLEQTHAAAYWRLLAAALIDLDSGYLSVGGLTAVGRGLFRISEITVDDGDKEPKVIKTSDNGWEGVLLNAIS